MAGIVNSTRYLILLYFGNLEIISDTSLDRYLHLIAYIGREISNILVKNRSYETRQLLF